MPDNLNKQRIMLEPMPKTKGQSQATALQAWIRALEGIKILDERPAAVFPVILDELAAAHGDRVCLVDEHGQLSFAALAARARAYAHWACARGLAAGEAVCLLLPNSPDYVAAWAGLTRIGCIAALINTNLLGDALAGCLVTSGARHIFVAAEFLPRLEDLRARLPEAMQVWVTDGEPAWAKPLILKNAVDALPAARQPGPHDVALLIYTSGTTGLPKAARVTHGRIVEWSFWFAGMMDVKPADRLYDCLPMYHSTGGVVAIGAMLVKGASVFISARFSARRFWDDVADQGCTIFMYIGELCRYLVNGPAHPRAAEHRLRLACGNGMARDVWETFQPRFGIPQILEFYAATEGNVSLYNCEGKPGAIGRIPPFLAHRFPIALVKCDAATGEVLRGGDGKCIKCAADEPGEAIGQLAADSAAPARQFSGYTDEAASAKKILRDVFIPGDRWFRTGDLMRKDTGGYYYFLDRIGDTFRWKGENVSTTEVAAVIGGCAGVTGAAVFGVAVPGHEGKAGMAALTTDETFDMAALQTRLEAHLPMYARPVFVRLCGALEFTGTFKLRKEILAREAYADATDPVWIYDRRAGAFRLWEEETDFFL